MERGQRLKAYAIAALGLLVAAPALWPPPFRLTDHVFFWYVGRLYLFIALLLAASCASPRAT